MGKLTSRLSSVNFVLQFFAALRLMTQLQNVEQVDFRLAMSSASVQTPASDDPSPESDGDSAYYTCHMLDAHSSRPNWTLIGKAQRLIIGYI